MKDSRCEAVLISHNCKREGPPVRRCNRAGAEGDIYCPDHQKSRKWQDDVRALLAPDWENRALKRERSVYTPSSSPEKAEDQNALPSREEALRVLRALA